MYFEVSDSSRLSLINSSKNVFYKLCNAVLSAILEGQ